MRVRRVLKSIPILLVFPLPTLLLPSSVSVFLFPHRRWLPLYFSSFVHDFFSQASLLPKVERVWSQECSSRHGRPDLTFGARKKEAHSGASSTALSAHFIQKKWADPPVRFSLALPSTWARVLIISLSRAVAKADLLLCTSREARWCLWSEAGRMRALVISLCNWLVVLVIYWLSISWGRPDCPPTGASQSICISLNINMRPWQFFLRKPFRIWKVNVQTASLTGKSNQYW